MNHNNSKAKVLKVPSLWWKTQRKNLRKYCVLKSPLSGKIALLDVKADFVSPRSGIKMKIKNISSTTFSQQIFGKNSDCQKKLPLKVF